MMRGAGFLCLGGEEIVNNNRTSIYVRQAGVSGLTSNLCLCDALDDDYPFTDPASDNAPWYDPAVDASEDFLGVWLSDLNLAPVMSRAANPRVDGGAVIGPLSLGKRIIQAKGLMFAKNASGMAYGERWLNAALAGAFCADGCRGDDAEILPACPELNEYDIYDDHFRTLINVGIIDGPTFQPVQAGVPDCVIQEVDFQLASGSPYLFGKKQRLLDHHAVSGPLFSPGVIASTNEWPGDGVLVIEIENDSTTNTSAVMDIQMHPTFDGTCDNLEGMPCWEVKVDGLKPGEIIFIDGQREDLLLYKPTTKMLYPALSKVVPQGVFFFDWPTVAPCSDICIKFKSGWSFPAFVTVDFIPRSF